jgi:HSP20 family molecular chaperone IbpA
VRIGGFNADDALPRCMSALRDALRDLPDAVFADLLESDDAYLLVVDLPGATAETVDVRVEGATLVIEARREKSVPPEFRFVDEDRSLFLDAQLPLPPDATGTDAEGTVADGVLELRLPKRSATPETAIPVHEG